ncbi:MAG: glycosyltransferase [Calditrichia bacterium]
MELDKLKIALVHDWLTGMRGGEKVLEILCNLFPDSDVFTLLHNKGSVSPPIGIHEIFTSFIDKMPLKRNHYRNYLPLFPTAIERFNFKDYDLIISTSHAVAKGIITPPDALHISYLHTPMRYVWDMYDEYFGADKTGWLSRKIIPFFANYLRMWDVSSSNRADWFLANSAHVAKRIKKYYRREATVIHPPVDTGLYKVSRVNGDYYLIVSALVPYKKVDLAVRAFNRMNKRLLVIGNGPERKKLQKLAGPAIEFRDWQPAEELLKYYGNCRALIFPGEEDFGIVPVEAMACGKPVIAYGKGGALETVIGVEEGGGGQPTGVFFNRQTEESLMEAMEDFEKREWNPDSISEHAKKFDKKNFEKNILKFIQEKVNLHFDR